MRHSSKTAALSSRHTLFLVLLILLGYHEFKCAVPLQILSRSKPIFMHCLSLVYCYKMHRHGTLNKKKIGTILPNLFQKTYYAS